MVIYILEHPSTVDTLGFDSLIESAKR